tara:strand:- start:26 stop:946 length:921 start_codon:yes stop_codon:yes gene_type:complete
MQFFSKPTYTSKAKIMSSTGGLGISQAAGLAAQFGINLQPNGGRDNKKWLYPDIIKSRVLARIMLNREFETIEFGSRKTLFSILTSMTNISPKDSSSIKTKAIDDFISMIKLSEDLVTGIYSISIVASEPILSTEINKVLIEELNLYQKRNNASKTDETRKFIKERIQATEIELNLAEEKLREFIESNRRIENSPTLQLESRRLTREVDVLVGVFTTLKQQFETTKIEAMKDSEYIVVIDPPEAPLYPTSPRKRVNVIISGFLGLGLGLIIALSREYINRFNKDEKTKIIKAKQLLITNVKSFIKL